MRAYLALPILIALPLVACGGNDEGRPPGQLGSGVGAAGAAGVDQCELAEQYELHMLVDFEPYTNPSGDLVRAARCEDALGATCSFYMNYDTASSPESEKQIVDPETREMVPQYPRGDDCLELLVDEDAKVFTSPEITESFPEGEPVEGGRCGEEPSALHIITRNVGMCIGSDGRSGWGAALDVTFTPPLDASDWDGISLWVKNGSEDGNAALILQLVDPYTSGAEDPATGEPTCDASEQPAPDHKKCDAFGTAVTLPDEWTFVPARFATLSQKGFGVVSPFGRLKADEIVRLQVLVDAGDAEFWIDDIALFRAAE